MACRPTVPQDTPPIMPHTLPRRDTPTRTHSYTRSACFGTLSHAATRIPFTPRPTGIPSKLKCGYKSRMQVKAGDSSLPGLRHPARAR
jgi:hypothetical protein